MRSNPKKLDNRYLINTALIRLFGKQRLFVRQQGPADAQSGNDQAT
jgi:hypothetical protein